ncbi:MAG: signal peptidase I [Minisyncoccia bacterium]
MNKTIKQIIWENKQIIWENIELVLIALAIVIPIKIFLIQPFIVKGSSMEPNFYTNDFLIVDEISYYFRKPQRYEVIVLKASDQGALYYSKNSIGLNLLAKIWGQYYIKRIIGLPNETVIINNGEVSVITFENKKINIDESYLSPNTLTNGNLLIKLKPNQYFVLGDNRNVSYDSRSWGPLDRNKIVGRVWLRVWPLNRITIFNNPIKPLTINFNFIFKQFHSAYARYKK